MIKYRKNLVLLVIFSALFFVILTIVVNALSCNSDFNCPGSGNLACRSNDNGKYLESWSCIEGECVSKINSLVGCCSSSDCAIDQVCDTARDYTCKGGSPYNQPNTTQSNTINSSLTIGIIITIAIVLGFIILGLILRRRRKVVP